MTLPPPSFDPADAAQPEVLQARANDPGEEPPQAHRDGAGIDPSTVLLDVVAEKTGYPKEMLDLDMELEARLGIDSIKQVEILSAIQERVPGLPEIAPGRLAELKTLGQIAGFMAEARGGAGAPSRVARHPSRAPPARLSATWSGTWRSRRPGSPFLDFEGPDRSS